MKGTYVYCVVKSAKPPRPSKAVAGLPGAGPVRALPTAEKGTWLIAADVPLESYGEKPLEAGLKDLDWVGRVAMAHEEVVEQFRGAEALVPMKLFTLFHSDQRALEHFAKDKRRIGSALTRVKGREEWGVRLFVDEKRAVAAAEARAGSRAAASTGAGYLLRKKEVRDALSEWSESAREAADAVYDALAESADDARRRTPAQSPAKGGKLLLDAAFLLPRQKAKSFTARAKKLGTRFQKDGYDVVVTGPWPPYNFVA